MNKIQARLRRREFLSGIGRAVGGSAMLRVMSAMGIATAGGCGSSSASSGAPGVPPPPPRPASPSPRPGDWPANVGSGRSVVILGAGMAGMTAALELGRLGYTCTLLEATAAAGGRVRTLRAGDTARETDSTQLCNFDLDDDLYFNCGPARIAHHHEFLLGYCREFGVALEPFVNDNRAALLQSSSVFGGEPQIARRILADTRGNIARLLASAINQNALDQELNANDRANVLGLLRQFGDLDGAGDYRGSDRAGFPGQEAAGSRDRGQLLDPRSLQELAQETFWQRRLDFSEQLNQQATMLQPVGGMDRIARVFESQLIQQIRFEAVVTQIRKIAGGARVVYRDRNSLEQAIDADHCICTIPASVLRSIDNDFSAAHKSAIAAFAYTPAVKLAFQSRRFWEQEHNIYGGVSWTTQDITQLWYPSHGMGSERGIMLGAYIIGGNAGSMFSARGPQQRIDTAVAQGSAVHAQLAAEAARGISVAWNKVPFQLGAWGVSDPGVLLTPDDRLFLAGEHLSMLQGWQEGAILSAYHAIDALVLLDSA